MRTVAVFFSVVAHPLLVPLYALFLVFHSGTVFSMVPPYTQYTSYLLTLMGPILLPVACLPLLKAFRLIDTYRLLDKHERVFPVLLTIVCSFAAFYLAGRLPYANIVRQFYLVMVILLSGFMILTIRWKMSMHMTAWGALCGFVFILGSRYFGSVLGVLSGLILISGIVGTSRLYLKLHSPAQVYAGFVYGAVLVVAILF